MVHMVDSGNESNLESYNTIPEHETQYKKREGFIRKRVRYSPKKYRRILTLSAMSTQTGTRYNHIRKCDTI